MNKKELKSLKYNFLSNLLGVMKLVLSLILWVIIGVTSFGVRLALSNNQNLEALCFSIIFVGACLLIHPALQWVYSDGGKK